MAKRQFLLVVGFALAFILLVPGRSNAQGEPDRRFGMTEAFWLPEEARELGVGWERILFYWREIQPEGPDDWNTLHVLEEWLVEADSQGREIVGLIKNTAPWASLDGSEAGLPQGLGLPIDDPDNLWANYVGRLADYYGPRGVHHWIIWNEPEIAQDVYGFEFAGTAIDYYQMLKIAYKVMKQRDPEAVIHLAGLTWWHDPTFLDRLLAIAAADPEAQENDYFFDAISLHIYFRTETIKSIIDDVMDIQGRYGLEKPVWINETNAPPNRDPEWPVDRPRFNIDLEQQAWFIVQALALGFASGAERVSVYKLLDIHLPPGGESFGLVRPDQSRRPAFDAYKMATHCFADFEEVSMQEDPLFYRITFARPGSLTHVAWSRTPAESVVSIPSTGAVGRLVKLSGASSALTAEEGMFELQLPGQRCDQECLVGGEPLVLVETIGEESYTKFCLDFQKADPAPTKGPTATSIPPRTPTVTAAPEALQMTPANANGQEGLPSSAAIAAVDSGDEQGPTATAIVTVAPTVESAGLTRPAGQAERPNSRDNARSSVGLWFLAGGALLALVILLLVLRARIDRKA